VFERGDEMTKYIVTKKFYDRYANMKLFVPGEIHVPHSEERAKQLLAQGFIAVAPEPENDKLDGQPAGGASEPEKARGKGRGKKGAGEVDGATAESE
jgi:hypothetical protein